MIGFGCNAKELVIVSAKFALCSYCFALKVVSIFDISPVVAVVQMQ